MCYSLGGFALHSALTGFEATAANLLSVPVYAWACLVTVGVGFLGDRIGYRGYINLYVVLNVLAIRTETERLQSFIWYRYVLRSVFCRRHSELYFRSSRIRYFDCLS